jgi:hypothetical protein
LPHQWQKCWRRKTSQWRPESRKTGTKSKEIQKLILGQCSYGYIFEVLLKNLKPFTMSLTLRTTLGCTEAVIADDGGLKRFYQIADIISEDLKIKFNNKEDDFDTIDWEFRFKGYNLTLHYNIYNGISIFPTKTRDALQKENKAVVELATLLEGKLFNEPERKIA